MTPYDAEVMARKLINEARTRAPSFVMLNHIFNDCLEQYVEDEVERAQIRDAAKQILAEEIQ